MVKGQNPSQQNCNQIRGRITVMVTVDAEDVAPSKGQPQTARSPLTDNRLI